MKLDYLHKKIYNVILDFKSCLKVFGSNALLETAQREENYVSLLISFIASTLSQVLEFSSLSYVYTYIKNI